MGNRIKNIQVEDKQISILLHNEEDYICLTDMVRNKEGNDHIRNWLRNRNTVEFIGLWEVLHNPNFKGVEFDTFRKQAGLHNFNLTPKKWIKTTNAIGFISKAGRYGGTYAHKDLAFEFGAWISPLFKLLLIKEFQRLKKAESQHLLQEWNVSRMIAKVNYRIHTDAIKENLMPAKLTAKQTKIIYASEADVLNMALFGKTAKQWRNNNPGKKGNIRDYANVTQLVCLSNLENLNAHFIGEEMAQTERLVALNKIAISQMKTLTVDQTKLLKKGK